MKFLTWGERLGQSECPYIRRWVLDFYFFSFRLHHWLSSDDQRNFHDHPWWYLTLILWGGYTDRSPDGEDPLSIGSIRFRPATHQHTVVVQKGGCWSFLITGPEKRIWGFWVNGRFRKRNKYFYMFGHHPCEK